MPSDKVVYTVLCADFVHAGHLNIIKRSRELGTLIVGVLTDEAIASYKRIPVVPYDKRKELVENIKGVKKVISQHTLDYTDNLRKLKPDIVTNGDDWRTGVQRETRKKVIEVLKEWNGKLIEFPYTPSISSTLFIEDFKKNGITPEQRMDLFRRLINCKPIVRVIESHSGMSASIIETLKHNGKEFDAIWESSFTDSASKGKPDIELVDFTSRIQTINEILEATTKPIIVDGDTGGHVNHFKYIVKTLERLGVSGIIIEDKVFPKNNSLLPGVQQIQEDVFVFSNKIREGKKVCVTDNFMIIARIESLIVGGEYAMENALSRAMNYISSGADGIVIHSKSNNPDEILDFCKQYKKLDPKVPLIAIPTTYNMITEKELIEAGVSVVIYANQLLRSSFNVMETVATSILENERSFETNPLCTSVTKISKKYGAI